MHYWHTAELSFLLLRMPPLGACCLQEFAGELLALAGPLEPSAIAFDPAAAFSSARQAASSSSAPAAGGAGGGSGRTQGTQNSPAEGAAPAPALPARRQGAVPAAPPPGWLPSSCWETIWWMRAWTSSRVRSTRCACCWPQPRAWRRCSGWTQGCGLTLKPSSTAAASPVWRTPAPPCQRQRARRQALL